MFIDLVRIITITSWIAHIISLVYCSTLKYYLICIHTTIIVQYTRSTNKNVTMLHAHNSKSVSLMFHKLILWKCKHQEIFVNTPNIFWILSHDFGQCNEAYSIHIQSRNCWGNKIENDLMSGWMLRVTLSSTKSFST